MVPARAAAPGDVAIVVRPETPVDNLSLGDLRRVLLGDRQFWSSNLRVTLLVRAPGAHEREVVLSTVYQMSEAQYRQYWIAKVFRAEASSAPRIVYSSEMAVELTSSLPGALAFVDASQVPKNLKVVKINGALPGDSKYPLR
jgi:ABC-type phosphate transport system substrate-binding protein